MATDPSGRTPAAADEVTVVGPPDGGRAPPPAIEGHVVPLLRGAQIGRYTVLKPLGAGGMGVVYLAIDPELDRKVAIKVLRFDHSAHGDDRGRARLLREARAMAKLSHPNVAAVYDVGEYGDELFVAMEYVGGTTLREWQRAKPRTTRAVVTLYTQAGRALAAAHAEGILHRDFKPENVLVDGRGRARVLDFGLARAESIAVDDADRSDRHDVQSAALSEPITQHGALVGTPAYMAPEQLRGEEIDARCDQFAFAVALWEALDGARPFQGASLGELVRAIRKGEARESSPGRIPRALRRVLLRALSRKPDARYPSMIALLRAIDREMRAPRRRLVAVGASVAAVATTLGIAALAARPAPPPPCRGAASSLAGAWDVARRGEVERAFRAAGAVGEATFTRVAPRLDEYARSLTAMSEEACVATRVQGLQSEEMLDLREACLAERLGELRATTDFFARADASVVDRATNLVDALASVSRCADVAALRAPFAPPRDETQAHDVESLRARIAALKVRFEAAQYGGGAPLAKAVADDAARIGYRPTLAEGLLWLGRYQVTNGQRAEGESTFFRGAVVAEAARHDDAAARAWTEMVRVTGYDLARAEDARRWAALADAAIERAGNDPELRAELVRQQANMLMDRGRYDDALAAYREVLALRERAYGKTNATTILTRTDMADVLVAKGSYAEALAIYADVEAAQIAARGEGHPLVGYARMQRGWIHVLRGEYDEAIPLTESALRAFAVTGMYYRPDALVVLGAAHAGQGKLDAGLGELREAIATLETQQSEGSASAALARFEVALAFARDRRCREARGEIDRAAEAFERAGDEGHPSLAAALGLRALCRAREGAAQDARGDAERAVAILEKVGAASTRDGLVAWIALGEARLGSGALDAASPLERAVAYCDAAPVDAVLAGDARLALARAVIASGGDAARARDLAARAADDYARGRHDDLAAAARAWVAAHAK